MSFNPDIRNLGGRKAISDIMSNHYSKISSVRPVLQTRDSPKSPSFSLKLPDFHTNSKISSKFSNFSSFSRSKKPRQSRLNKTQMSNHYNNIKHMKRRINDIGSLIERKKNRFDPISNPVMFFRENVSNTPILGDEYIKKMLRPPKTSGAYDGREDKTELARRFNTPTVERRDAQEIEVLKNDILEEIVRKRIYRDEDLDRLFNRARRAYSHFRTDIVENIIKEVRYQIES